MDSNLTICETLCRIHVPLVHREISNHSSFSTKFQSYKSVFFFFTLMYMPMKIIKHEYEPQGTDLCNPRKC